MRTICELMAATSSAFKKRISDGGIHSRPSPAQVKQVCRFLTYEYRRSRLGNKCNPLDEYLYILLSLRTHQAGFQESYRRFKEAFPTWDSAHRATTKRIAKAIQPGGLACQKAKRIKQALRTIRYELGELSLRKLKRFPEDQVEAFLRRLPGVGLKSAKCIMMYSLDFHVLPVDTHVARVSTRLGWVASQSSQQLHRELEGLVPPSLRLDFHVSCVQHGRAKCRGQYPQCDQCCLAEICPRIDID